MSSLSPEFATEVRDLLLCPPAETPYEQLKAELTRRTSASEQRRIKELLSNEELGDRTPSQVLRRIQQLLGSMATTMDPTLLGELFLQRLPPNVRMVLTPSAAALSLEQLAQLADRIVEASPTPATISAVDTHSQLTTQVMELSKRLDQLTNQMSGAINNITNGMAAPLVPADVVGAAPLSPGMKTPHTHCAGTIENLETTLRSANRLAKNRETTRPVAFDDKRYWPLTQSPTLSYRQKLRTPFPH